ncbi:MAG: hypothetical protein KF795_22450 [Labilithrix sp.]|nr:hypothetical protein [Labilithrix sp.]
MTEESPKKDEPEAEAPATADADAPTGAEATAATADATADATATADADADATADVPADVPADADADALAALGDRDAVFEALWKRALEAWDDDKPHAALLEHALKSDKLPDLAGRYRALESDPDKSARARKKIDGIVVAATQMLMATKTPPRTKTPWQWSAGAALTFAIVCAWLFYQLFVPHR